MTALPEPTAVQPSTMREDRYPGALPFADTPLDWLRFFGRENEAQALLHQFLSVDLLVFFGRSGVGKTSLLKAAIFPLLRKRDFLPVPVYFNESVPALEIVQNAVADACKREQIDYTVGSNGSLWEFFKTAIFWRDDRVQTPVLLFDQFEEVFTLQREEFRRALAAELGQLTASRLPEHLRQSTVGPEAEESVSDRGNRLSFTEKPPEMKILIGLREDYLGALQEFAPAIPEILLNRFRLTGLPEENARRAIIEPAILVSEEVQFSAEPFTYTDDTLSRMIAVARDEEEGTIEPFVLQLLCSHVEKQVRDKQTAANPGKVGPRKEKQDSTSSIVLSHGVRLEVDFSYLGGEKGIRAITVNFYFDVLKRLPYARLRRRARAMCEEGFLTAAGRRRRMLQDDLLKRFKLPQQALDTLESACLLRKEPRHCSFYYEISHDRLAEAIHQSRKWRVPREVQVVVAGILIITIFAAVAYSSIAGIQAEREKERAREEIQRAEQARRDREEAERVLDYIIFDLRDRLTSLGGLSFLEDIQKQVAAYYERMGNVGESDEILRRKSVFIDNQGDLSLNRGDLPSALSSYNNSLEIRQKLAARDPANTDWQRDLSLSHQKIGGVQSAQGDLTAALSSYQKGLEIREKLAARDPTNTDWQNDLSLSHDNIGGVQSAQGDLTAALSSHQKGLEIREKLAARDPTNTGWRRDLSVSYERIGDVQSAQGDLTAALSSYQKDFEITEKLAARDPANTLWQRDLSISYEKLGNVQSAQGDLTAALSSYQKGLEIAEKLAARDPANTDWQRDLSISHERIGGVQSAQDDLTAALSSYQKNLEIREKLAARDPTNSLWQRDLSVSYERIGDVQRAQSDLTAALISYQKDLELRETLAARDAANAQWKIDLVISLWKLAGVLEQQGTPQKREAAVNYQRALEILRLLADENRLTTEQQTWISKLEARLKTMGY